MFTNCYCYTFVLYMHLTISLCAFFTHSCPFFSYFDNSRCSKRSEVKVLLSLPSLDHNPELSFLSLNHDLAPVSDIHPARWLASLLAALEVE